MPDEEGDFTRAGDLALPSVLICGFGDSESADAFSLDGVVAAVMDVCWECNDSRGVAVIIVPLSSFRDGERDEAEVEGLVSGVKTAEKYINGKLNITQ